MMIDDDTLKQLLRINHELLQLCKWLNDIRRPLRKFNLRHELRLKPLAIIHFLPP